MDKNQENKKNIESKINLNNLFSQKEIDNIEKIIPEIKIMTNSNENNINENPNKISQENTSNQFIDKNKFIELILEKAQLIFKEENNIAFSKSISYILKDIRQKLNESETKKKNEKIKLTKKSINLNSDEKIKLIEKKIFKKRKSPKKKSLFITINPEKEFLYSHTKNNIKSNDFISFSQNSKIYKNKINNTMGNTEFKKIIDFGYNNKYKLRNIKGNSIINNFITFSNSNHSSGNFETELNFLNRRIFSKKNKINIMNSSQNSSKSKKFNNSNRINSKKNH